MMLAAMTLICFPDGLITLRIFWHFIAVRHERFDRKCNIGLCYKAFYASLGLYRKRIIVITPQYFIKNNKIIENDKTHRLG